MTARKEIPAAVGAVKERIGGVEARILPPGSCRQPPSQSTSLLFSLISAHEAHLVDHLHLGKLGMSCTQSEYGTDTHLHLHHRAGQARRDPNTLAPGFFRRSETDQGQPYPLHNRPHPHNKSTKLHPTKLHRMSETAV